MYCVYTQPKSVYTHELCVYTDPVYTQILCIHRSVYTQIMYCVYTQPKSVYTHELCVYTDPVYTHNPDHVYTQDLCIHRSCTVYTHNPSLCIHTNYVYTQILCIHRSCVYTDMCIHGSGTVYTHNPSLCIHMNYVYTQILCIHITQIMCIHRFVYTPRWGRGGGTVGWFRLRWAHGSGCLDRGVVPPGRTYHTPWSCGRSWSTQIDNTGLVWSWSGLVEFCVYTVLCIHRFVYTPRWGWGGGTVGWFRLRWAHGSGCLDRGVVPPGRTYHTPWSCGRSWSTQIDNTGLVWSGLVW